VDRGGRQEWCVQPAKAHSGQLNMSRTQPPGGRSSINLSWNEPRQSYEHRHPSVRRQTSSRTHRRDEVQKAPPPPTYYSRGDAVASRAAGRSNGRPLSARAPDPKSRSARTERKPELATSSMSRSQPHFGHHCNDSSRRHAVQNRNGHHSARAEYSAEEWARASRARATSHDGKQDSRDWGSRRCSGKDIQPSRTLPGEELHSPIKNSWMDHADEPLLSSRSNPQTNIPHTKWVSGAEPRHGNADINTRQRFSGTKAVHSKRLHRGDSEGPKLRPEKDHQKSRRHAAGGLGPYHWSMGSSVDTSAQGSVIDSYPEDLWDTSSVDSLPLGAEWFNFMHGRK